MQVCQTMWKGVGTAPVVLTFGFGWGFLQATKLGKKTLRKPLKTLFRAAIDGAMYAVGALAIAVNMPENARGLVPVLLVCASGYKVYEQLTDDQKQVE